MSLRKPLFVFPWSMPLAIVILATLSVPAPGATYYVDGQSSEASDDQPGTAEAPWKTVSRAASAQELQPGDTVVIHSGVYREHVEVKVSGQPERPITFTAAPGARVVLKGSELVRGAVDKLAEQAEIARNLTPTPLPASGGSCSATNSSRIRRFQGGYQDKARRWVSQVFLNDNKPLQRIGPDPIYQNDEYLKVGHRRPRAGRHDRGLVLLRSVRPEPVHQDRRRAGLVRRSKWACVVSCSLRKNIHDVVIRGLELRHNRQPGGQWPMVSVGQCERVVIEDCRIYGSDFCGLGVGRSRDCIVRGCDLSYNGNTGLGMGECRDCTIEDCTLLFNNYRRFHSGWHCGRHEVHSRQRALHDSRLRGGLQHRARMASGSTATTPISASWATSATTTTAPGSSTRSTRAAASSPTTWCMRIAVGGSTSRVRRTPGSSTIRWPGTTAASSACRAATIGPWRTSAS